MPAATSSASAPSSVKSSQAARALAEERKKLADESFKEALDAVKAQVFDMNNELKNRSGTRDLREKLSKSVTERLKKLVDRATRTSDVDHVAFRAYVNLGDVYLDADGRVQDSVLQYTLSRDNAARRAAADPSNTEAQTDLMVSHRKLWTLAMHDGQYRLALRYLRDCRAIASRLEAEGKLHGQFKDAVAIVEKDISICELMLKLSPGLLDDPSWALLWGWPRF